MTAPTGGGTPGITDEDKRQAAAALRNVVEDWNRARRRAEDLGLEVFADFNSAGYIVIDHISSCTNF